MKLFILPCLSLPLAAAFSATAKLPPALVEKAAAKLRDGGCKEASADLFTKNFEAVDANADLKLSGAELDQIVVPHGELERIAACAAGGVMPAPKRMLAAVQGEAQVVENGFCSPQGGHLIDSSGYTEGSCFEACAADSRCTAATINGDRCTSFKKEQCTSYGITDDGRVLKLWCDRSSSPCDGIDVQAELEAFMTLALDMPLLVSYMFHDARLEEVAHLQLLPLHH